MLTPYELDLTRAALAVEIKPRGPQARRMAEEAQRAAKRREESAVLEARLAEHREPQVEIALMGGRA